MGGSRKNDGANEKERRERRKVEFKGRGKEDKEKHGGWMKRRNREIIRGKGRRVGRIGETRRLTVAVLDLADRVSMLMEDDFLITSATFFCFYEFTDDSTEERSGTSLSSTGFNCSSSIVLLSPLRICECQPWRMIILK